MKPTYIAPNATVVGDVILEENANIWYGAVLRGDHGTITLGEGTLDLNLLKKIDTAIIELNNFDNILKSKEVIDNL